MIKAFLAVAMLQFVALAACIVVVIGVTARMSVRAAEYGLTLLALMDIASIAIALWGFRRLGQHWSAGMPVPTWSVWVLGVWLTLVGLVLLFFSVIALNR